MDNSLYFYNFMFYNLFSCKNLLSLCYGYWLYFFILFMQLLLIFEIITIVDLVIIVIATKLFIQ